MTPAVLSPQMVLLRDRDAQLFALAALQRVSRCDIVTLWRIATAQFGLISSELFAGV